MTDKAEISEKLSKSLMLAVMEGMVSLDLAVEVIESVVENDDETTEEAGSIIVNIWKTSAEGALQLKEMS